MKLLWLLIGAIVLFPPIARTQELERMARVPSVTATGEAVITAEPDQAEIDIGVVSQARSAPEAGKDNAERVARVLAEVRKILGKGDEVKTSGYSLTPNYRYPQGGKPEIVGYTATNVLRIKTAALANVGKLIDTATQSGANTIRRLVFTLKDEQKAQIDALRLASEKAKAKAEAIAAALGLKTVRILAITEGERGIRPVVMSYDRSAAAERLAAAPTPVESGTIEVRSSVTLTAEIGAR